MMTGAKAINEINQNITLKYSGLKILDANLLEFEHLNEQNLIKKNIYKITYKSNRRRNRQKRHQ